MFGADNLRGVQGSIYTLNQSLRTSDTVRFSSVTTGNLLSPTGSSMDIKPSSGAQTFIYGSKMDLISNDTIYRMHLEVDTSKGWIYPFDALNGIQLPLYLYDAANNLKTDIKVRPSSSDKGFNVDTSSTGRFGITSTSANNCIGLAANYNSTNKSMIAAFDANITAWTNLYIQDGGNTKFGVVANAPTERVDIDGNVTVTGTYKIGTVEKLSATQLNGQNNFPSTSGKLAIVGAQSYLNYYSTAPATAYTTNFASGLGRIIFMDLFAYTSVTTSDFTPTLFNTSIYGFTYTGVPSNYYKISFSFTHSMSSNSGSATITMYNNSAIIGQSYIHMQSSEQNFSFSTIALLNYGDTIYFDSNKGTGTVSIYGCNVQAIRVLNNNE